MSAISGALAPVSTAFGSVNNDHITYYANKGWLSGGSQTDVPLRHVTSVRLETTRRPVLAIVALLIGIPMLLSGSSIMIVGLVFAVLGAVLLWGSPKVVINTAGGDLTTMTGLPWTRDEAESFVRAVRAQLFKD